MKGVSLYGKAVLSLLAGQEVVVYRERQPGETKPPYAQGSRVYVRETFGTKNRFDANGVNWPQVVYHADGGRLHKNKSGNLVTIQWRPPHQMTITDSRLRALVVAAGEAPDNQWAIMLKRAD